jgi:hypothetical protein
MGPLCTSATEWPIVPAPGDYDDGEFGGMKIGRGNLSTRRKPFPATISPPQIPPDQTRAAAVGSQRLTAWAMARPHANVTNNTQAYACVHVYVGLRMVHVLQNALLALLNLMGECMYVTWLVLCV